MPGDRRQPDPGMRMVVRSDSGGYSGSEKRDGVCQILADAGQDPFSRRGEDKIRGSSGNKEEEDAKEN